MVRLGPSPLAPWSPCRPGGWSGLAHSSAAVFLSSAAALIGHGSLHLSRKLLELMRIIPPAFVIAGHVPSTGHAAGDWAHGSLSSESSCAVTFCRPADCVAPRGVSDPALSCGAPFLTVLARPSSATPRSPVGVWFTAALKLLPPRQTGALLMECEVSSRRAWGSGLARRAGQVPSGWLHVSL